MPQHPIISKLKLNYYPEKLLLNVPAHVNAFEGMICDRRLENPAYDLIFAFIFSLDEFSARLQQIIDGNLLRPGGYFYFAYPKKNNKMYDCYIGRDDFFVPAYMDAEGFVMKSRIKFNKMVAFDEIFSCIGLKHIVASAKKSSGPSQCIADYVDRVADLRNLWSEADPVILGIYDSLTPGYQRDWARFVYSVRSEETRIKRLGEMAQALSEGYKSIDLYKRR